jgi:hypothetical protein
MPSSSAHPAPLAHWSQTKEKCTFFLWFGTEKFVFHRWYSGTSGGDKDDYESEIEKRTIIHIFKK